MNSSFFLGLVYNASLLLVMVIVFDLFVYRSRGSKSIIWCSMVGLILGGIGMAVMLTHWELLPGVIFDTRSVLLGVIALYFGWIPTLIAMVMMIGLRLSQGGVGVLMGVPVIILSSFVGLSWRAVRLKRIDNLSLIELYLLGISVHFGMLMCTFFLPAELGKNVLSAIWMPVMLIYPVATMILGEILKRKLRLIKLTTELSESVEKYMSLFANMVSGFAYHRIVLNKDGKPVDYEFLEMNEAFEKLTGMKREDALGRRVTEVIPEILKDDFDWIGEYGKVAMEGSVLKTERFVLPFKKWYSIQAYSPKKEYFAVSFSDITEEKESEQELLALNQQLIAEKLKMFTILRDMGDAVFVTDTSRKITLANKTTESLFKVSEKELLGKSIEEALDLFYINSKVRPKDLFEKVFDEKKTVKPKEVLVLKRVDGSAIKLDGVISPLVDENENMIGSVWVFRDVTREKQVDKMKTDFISLASHQLRTPLTGIKWIVELLDLNAPKMSIDKVQEYIRKIGDSNDRMIDLVNGLMTTSKVDSGKIEKSVEKYSVRDLMQQAIDQQGRLFLDKDIKLIGIKNIPIDWTLETDMVQMTQVFGNLFNNAASYSSAGSTIEVKGEKIDDCIKISVKDSGVGIPAEARDSVFGKFFRADNVSKTIPGSGLGLYVAKSIVESHGGRIWFESKENTGTTFFVELPIKQKDEKKESDDCGG